MTYDVILRKTKNKYVARVRDWPEVVIEEDSREAAITQIKAQLAEELQDLWQRVETMNIVRLQALAALAQRRGTDVRALMRDLGVADNLRVF